MSKSSAYQLSGLTLVALVLLLIIYARTLGAPPLLDEAWILTWLKESSGSKDLLSVTPLQWQGPIYSDTWSYVSSGVLSLFAGLSGYKTTPIRILNLLIHFINVILVFQVFRKALVPAKLLPLGDNVHWLALAIALMFAVYPLTCEAVFWLGGLAYSLGLAFLLGSFCLYLTAREERSWVKIGLGCSLYLLALFCDSSLWAASFALVSLELARDFLGEKRSENPAISKAKIEAVEDMEDAVEMLLSAEKDGQVEKSAASNLPKKEESVFDTLLPVLPFLALGALVPIGSLPTYGTETLAKELVIQPADWLTAAKVFWFPVNQSINDGYNKLYSWLYIIYGIGLAAVPIAFFFSRAFRQNFAFLFVWLLMATVPHLHQSISNDTMVGARWFYHATLPICGLAVLYFLASAYAANSFEKSKNLYVKIPVAIVCFALSLALVIFSFGRSSKQLKAYLSATNVTQKITSSVFTVCSKANQNFVIVRNIPFYSTVSGITTPFNLILMDSSTQLIKAPKLVGGKIKDRLKEGKLKDQTMHWEHDLLSIIPIDLGVAGDADKPFMDAAEIVNRLIPPINYWKTAKYDEANNIFELFSNWDAGPVLTVSANGFDPLGPDFVYIDARIDVPKIDQNAEVELSWLTTWGKELERRDRLTQSSAITNDGNFHRYYFPVRSAAWTTNGVIQQLSFGFPKGASVKIREIGAVEAPERIPAFTHTDSGSGEQNSTRSMLAGCIDYPNNSEFGLSLITGADKTLKFSYDASSVKDAVKATCEVSKPNCFFENPNGYKYSKNKLKVFHLESLKGEMSVKVKELKEPGIYSFRVFAVDNNGNQLANASDEIICLIDNNATK
ncbi:MAG: hypothetical protein KC652_19975 [Cyanobacteria bacterium HKST-UBA01]|nr:hypothetical protein [Cyanobacteria bacterium HKST-UBA01]